MNIRTVKMKLKNLDFNLEEMEKEELEYLDFDFNQKVDFLKSDLDYTFKLLANNRLRVKRGGVDFNVTMKEIIVALYS